MAITPTHLDSFRSASPSSIPPAADTLTGTVVAPAPDPGPQTAFHRRFFGTEIEQRLTKRLESVQGVLTQIVRDTGESVKNNVSDGNADLRLKLDGVDRNVIGVDDKVKPVASVDSQIGAVKASVGDGLNTKVVELFPRLDAVSTSVGANLGAQVSLLGPKIDSASTVVRADLQKRADAIELRLTDVTQNVATEARAVGEKLVALTARVGSVETVIGDLKRDLGTLLECVGQIKACVDDLKKQLCEPAEPTGSAPKTKKP